MCKYFASSILYRAHFSLSKRLPVMEGRRIVRFKGECFPEILLKKGIYRFQLQVCEVFLGSDAWHTCIMVKLNEPES